MDGKNEIWQLYCLGAEKKPALAAPHGTEIVEEAAIQQKLSTVLRFGGGTYEKFFWHGRTSWFTRLSASKQIKRPWVR